jgi:hypothetical protein
LLGEYSDLLGGKKIIDVPSLEPSKIKLNYLFVGDLAL